MCTTEIKLYRNVFTTSIKKLRVWYKEYNNNNNNNNSSKNSKSSNNLSSVILYILVILLSKNRFKKYSEICLNINQHIQTERHN